jgi:HAD superfamily hydrolase (TIGR01549 family)
MDRLPRVEIAGRSVPSTAGALHEALAARLPVPFESFSAALREIDRDWRETAAAEGRELPTVERFTRLLERFALRDADLAERLTRIHMGLIAGVARTPAHHADVLDRLRRGVRVGLCSNFSHSPTALAILDDARLRERLDAVAISHDVGLRKPRREIFEAVLGALGAAPEQSVHVGDSLDADVAGAAALGMRTVWVTRCVPDPDAALTRHGGPQPDWIVRDLAEIPAIIENLLEV